jgi:hypothetical protein
MVDTIAVELTPSKMVLPFSEDNVLTRCEVQYSGRSMEPNVCGIENVGVLVCRMPPGSRQPIAQ